MVQGQGTDGEVDIVGCEEDQLREALGTAHVRPLGAASLLGCLRRFIRPEQLGLAERWTCDRHAPAVRASPCPRADTRGDTD